MIYCVNPVHPVQKKDLEVELIGGEALTLRLHIYQKHPLISDVLYLHFCGTVSSEAFGDLQTCGTVSSKASKKVHSCGMVSSKASKNLHSCELGLTLRQKTCIPAE